MVSGRGEHGFEAGGGIALQQLGVRPALTVVRMTGGGVSPGSGGLLDSHGRVIRDLRISITDRCNFRCVYCMEPGVRFAGPGENLSEAEVVRLARVCAGLGIRKVRLTGGEPTLHPGLTGIIAGIRGVAPVEIAMTTNGSLLREGVLREWRGAGLTRITISIDSLREERFARITRGACGVETVLGAIGACERAGFEAPKLNVVLMRGVNEDEAPDFAALARRTGVEVRFIEFMPLDAARRWDPGSWVPAAETRARIEGRFPLVELERESESATARVFGFADGSHGRVGFIAPLSEPFCGACSRLRITADGKVRACLFSTEEWDLMGVLRGGGDDAALAGALAGAVWNKRAGHGIGAPGFTAPERTMSAIGG